MKTYIAAMLFLFAAIPSHAQLEKIIHKSFEVETIDNVTLDISGECTVEKWAGNMILVETVVKLYDAGSSVLKYFTNQGRYDIIRTQSDNSITLTSRDKRKSPIRTQNGNCEEVVYVKLLVPEDFKVVNNTLLTREKEVEGLPTTSARNN